MALDGKRFLCPFKHIFFTPSLLTTDCVWWLTNDYFVIRFFRAFEPQIRARHTRLSPSSVSVCVFLDSQRQQPGGRGSPRPLDQDRPGAADQGLYQSAAYRQHHFYYHTLQQHRLWRTNDGVSQLRTNWKVSQKLGKTEGFKLRHMPFGAIPLGGSGGWIE